MQSKLVLKVSYQVSNNKLAQLTHPEEYLPSVSHLQNKGDSEYIGSHWVENYLVQRLGERCEPGQKYGLLCVLLTQYTNDKHC